MRVRMLVAMPDGATCDGQPWPKKGDVADFPPHQAAHFIASGIAEPEPDEADKPAIRKTSKAAKEVTTDGEAGLDERTSVHRNS